MAVDTATTGVEELAPKKVTGWRRVRRWTVRLLLGLLVLVVAGLVFLHTGPGQDFVRGRLESALSERVHGTITIGDLDFVLLGDVSLSDVVVEREGAGKAVSVEQVDVALDWGSLLSDEIVVETLTVTGVDLEGDRLQGLGKPRDKPMSKAIRVDALALRELSMRRSRPDGGRLVITGARLDASLATNPTDQSLEATIDGLGADVTLERPERPALELPLAVKALKATRKDGVLTVAIDGVSAGEADIAALKLALGGTGDQSLVLEGLKLPAAAVNALLGPKRGRLASDVTAALSATGPANAMKVAGDVDTLAGKLALTGSLDLSDLANPGYDLRLEAPAVDAAKLLTGGPALTTSMAIGLRGHGLVPGTMDADVTVDIGKTTLGDRTLDSFEVDARMDGGALKMDRVVLQVLGHEVKLDGGVDPATGKVKVHLSSAADVGKLMTRLASERMLKTPIPDLRGREVSVDLTVEGVPDKDAPAMGKLPAIPVKSGTLKGSFRASELGAGERGVGSLAVDVDLAAKDGRPSGTVKATMKGVSTGKVTLDGLEATMTVDGTAWTVELSARDEKLGLTAKARLSGELQPETMAVSGTLETLDVTLGDLRTRLREPVTVELPAGFDLAKPTRLKLPRTALELAGGTIALAADVTLQRVGEHLQVPRFDVSFDVSDLNVSALPAVLRGRLRGLAGRVDAHVQAAGTPEDPRVSFQLATGFRGMRIHARGAVGDGRAGAEVRVKWHGREVARVDVAMPLPGHPGRMSADVRLDRLELASLVPRLAETLGEAAVSGRIRLSGTRARPAGSVDLTVEQAPLGPLGAGTVKVAAAITPEGRGTAIEGSAAVMLFDDTEPYFSVERFALRTGRSPLVSRRTTWEAELALAPIGFDALPKPAGLAQLSGRMTLTASLSGRQRKLTGADVRLLLSDVALPERFGPLDVETTAKLDDDALKLGLGVSQDGAELVGVALGLPAKLKPLLAAVKSRRLDAIPLDARVTLGEIQLATLREVLPRLPAVAGKLQGSFGVSGTAADPRLDGSVRWLDGPANGPVEVAFATADGSHSLRIAHVPTGIAATIALPSDAATAFFQRKRDDLLVTARLDAPPSDLATIAAKVGVADKVAALDAKGRLRADLEALIRLVREPEGSVAPTFDGASGGLHLEEASFALPGTPRRWHDTSLSVELKDDLVRLASLEVHESDEDKDDRSLRVTGAIPWRGEDAMRGHLELETTDFLVVGKVDAPEGELTSEATIDVDLTGDVRKAAVRFSRLNLNAPSRFIRDHYQQTMGWGDVIEVEDPAQVGKLPKVPRPFWMDLPPDPAPDAPDVGWDAVIVLPPETHLLKSPIDLFGEGEIHVRQRPGALKVTGGLTFQRGKARLIGLEYTLDRGQLVLPGPLTEAQLRLDFVRQPPDPMRRDEAVESAGGGPIRFGIRIDLPHGQQLVLGGASGPYLVDAFAVQNAGRARLGGEVARPSSSVVQMPHDEQPLVFTFLQTNLQHFMFLDRINAWAPRDGMLEGQYGQVRNLEGDIYTEGNKARIRLLGHEPETATSEAELRYDHFLWRDDRTLLGVGASAGSRLQAGLELFVEWSSRR